MTAPRKLGPLLRYCRHMLGASIRHVAEDADVSYSYLSKLERGSASTPSQEVLEALAGALGVAPTRLLKAAGHPTRDDAAGLLELLVDVVAYTPAQVAGSCPPGRDGVTAARVRAAAGHLVEVAEAVEGASAAQADR